VEPVGKIKDKRDTDDDYYEFPRGLNHSIISPYVRSTS
jgi:hypothetical protein